MGMKRRPVEQAEYIVFYDFAKGASLSSDDNKRMKHADIYVMIGELTHDEDFLGMVDANGAVLQMIYNGRDDTYSIEIPDPARKGSSGTTVSFDELVDVMKTLPREFSVHAFPQFEFHLWADEN